MFDERLNLIDLQESVWKSLETLCTDLTGEEWLTYTDCPNWTVRDCLAHLVGIEHRLLGKDVPELVLDNIDHIRNDQGRKNEVDVISRRENTIGELLAEFISVNSQRLDVLKSQSDFSIPADSPIGRGNISDQVSVRIFDCWIHEQDIRRAINKRGNLSGPVAEHSYQRMIEVMPFILGKKVGAREGSSVGLEIQGDHPFDVYVQVVEGRAKLTPVIPDPTATLKMSSQTFICLCCGRTDPEESLKSNLVSMYGDCSLATLFVRKMNYMV